MSDMGLQEVLLVNRAVIEAGAEHALWCDWLFVRMVEDALASGELPSAVKWLLTWGRWLKEGRA